MMVIITYDVNTETKAGRRRLRRVAQTCEDYGQRVQKSVFECHLGDPEWVVLRARLLGEISDETDSLRFYFLNERDRLQIEHHGQGKPRDPDTPLVV